MIKVIITLLLIGALTGCASTMKAAVLDRAPFDLDCPISAVTIHDLGTGTYGVTGCDKRATYILQGTCSSKSTCRAIMNSDAKNK